METTTAAAAASNGAGYMYQPLCNPVMLPPELLGTGRLTSTTSRNTRKHPRDEPGDLVLDTGMGRANVEQGGDEGGSGDIVVEEDEVDDAEELEDDDDDDDVDGLGGVIGAASAAKKRLTSLALLGDSAAGGSAGELPIGRRMRLTLGQKREVVDLAASKKFTHKELAEKFRVGRTTITNICRQEDLIRNETDSADATKKKRKTTKCTYDLRVLDECLHKWRMEVKVSSPDTKLTGTVLQQKAMDIAMKIAQEPFADLPDKVRAALSKFSASNGWLDGYRTRFGSFSSKQFHGDANVIKNVDIQTRLREIHHSLIGVDVQDIWTGSEFAVAFKPHPQHTHSNAHHHNPNHNHQQPTVANNGRYTLSLFVSAAGEAFDLQVIGVDRSPLLLEDVDTQKQFQIHYGHSKTGWQVAHTMVTMLKALNARAKMRKRTFRVILDSAVPHVKAAMFLDSQGDQRTFFVFDHLQIHFLPPNFKPPRFHPCHLGVIQAFKARFRHEMLETLFTCYRQSSTMGPNATPHSARGFTPAEHLHSRNVFHWFHVALHSLDKHLIQNCWIQSGLLPTQVVAHLNVKEILLSATSGTAAAASGGAAPGREGGGGGGGKATDGSAGPLLTTANASSQLGTVVAHVNVVYRDLQYLMAQIAQLAPEFLHWVGVNDPRSAQAYVEMEGNASVTDPGIDELQIIRSVLQKHGYLATKRLDDATHASGRFGSMAAVAHEPCPRHEEVLASVAILKRYLRLTRDEIPQRVEAVVQLNKLQTHVANAAAESAFAAVTALVAGTNATTHTNETTTATVPPSAMATGLGHAL